MATKFEGRGGGEGLSDRATKKNTVFAASLTDLKFCGKGSTS